MKFIAHTTTTNAIDAATSARWGARPAAVSTLTESGQPLFAHRELLDAVHLWCVADSRPARHANGSLRRHRHFRLDNVRMPVPRTRRHIARQNKIRQRGKRDVVRPSNPGLQHPPAPHGNAVRLAQIMDLLGHFISANSPQLDVDDLAGPERD